eukprot:m51a1_g605 hypothetical protein (229) ;mRNA; r:84159-85276
MPIAALQKLGKWIAKFDNDQLAWLIIKTSVGMMAFTLVYLALEVVVMDFTGVVMGIYGVLLVILVDVGAVLKNRIILKAFSALFLVQILLSLLLMVISIAAKVKWQEAQKNARFIDLSEGLRKALTYIAIPVIIIAMLFSIPVVMFSSVLSRRLQMQQKEGVATPNAAETGVTPASTPASHTPVAYGHPSPYACPPTARPQQMHYTTEEPDSRHIPAALRSRLAVSPE